MVTTVTVCTITTIAAAAKFNVGIGVFVILLLLCFLVGQELLGASVGTRKKLLSRFLNISIIPMITGSAVIIGIKVAEILA